MFSGSSEVCEKEDEYRRASERKSELESSKSHRQGLLEELKRKHSEVTRELSALREPKASTAAFHASLEARLLRTRKDLDAKRQELAALEEQRDVEQSETEILRDRLRRVQANRVGLQTARKVAPSQAGVEHATSTGGEPYPLEEVAVEAASLAQRALQALERRTVDVAEKIQSLQDETRALDEQRKEVMATTTVLQNELRAAQNMKTQLDTNVGVLVAEVSTLEATVNSAQTDLDAAHKAKDSLEAEIPQVVGDLSTCRQDMLDVHMGIWQELQSARDLCSKAQQMHRRVAAESEHEKKKLSFLGQSHVSVIAASRLPHIAAPECAIKLFDGDVHLPTPRFPRARSVQSRSLDSCS